MSVQEELDEAFVEVATHVKSIHEFQAASAVIIDVVTGNEPRGDFPGLRIWAGGNSRPVNATTTDLWLSSTVIAKPPVSAAFGFGHGPYGHTPYGH